MNIVNTKNLQIKLADTNFIYLGLCVYIFGLGANISSGRLCLHRDVKYILSHCDQTKVSTEMKKYNMANIPIIGFYFRFCAAQSFRMAACIAVIGKENSPLYVHCAIPEQVTIGNSSRGHSSTQCVKDIEVHSVYWT